MAKPPTSSTRTTSRGTAGGRPAAGRPTGSRPAGVRPDSGRRVPTKKQRRRGSSSLDRMLRPWWQAPWVLVGGGIGAVAAIVLIVILIVNVAAPPALTFRALPASVLTAVTDPSSSVVSQVGGGSGVVGGSGQPVGDMVRISPPKLLTDSGGTPEVVFVGAEYCPYCAAERWAMVMALSRFGTFSNLQEMASSPSDVYPNTHTVTFYNSSYSSQYIDFVPTEEADRNETALQAPTTAVNTLFNTYGQPPYQAQGNNPGYPFLDIAGRFTIYAVQYSPAVLEDSSGNPLTWQQIAADLSNPQSAVAKGIIGSANYLTAAICVATGNQPSGVCSSSTITSLENSIQSQTAVAPPSSS